MREKQNECWMRWNVLFNINICIYVPAWIQIVNHMFELGVSYLMINGIFFQINNGQWTTNNETWNVKCLTLPKWLNQIHISWTIVIHHSSFIDFVQLSNSLNAVGCEVCYSNWNSLYVACIWYQTWYIICNLQCLIFVESNVIYVSMCLQCFVNFPVDMLNIHQKIYSLKIFSMILSGFAVKVIQNCQGLLSSAFLNENFDWFFILNIFFRIASQSIHVKTKADEDHEVYRCHSNWASHKKRMRLNDFQHFMFLYIFIFSFHIRATSELKRMYQSSHQPDVITYNQILCSSECHNMLHDDVTTYSSSIRLVYRHSYLIKMTNTKPINSKEKKMKKKELDAHA